MTMGQKYRYHQTRAFSLVLQHHNVQRASRQHCHRRHPDDRKKSSSEKICKSPNFSISESLLERGPTTHPTPSLKSLSRKKSSSRTPSQSSTFSITEMHADGGPNASVTPVADTLLAQAALQSPKFAPNSPAVDRPSLRAISAKASEPESLSMREGPRSSQKTVAAGQCDRAGETLVQSSPSNASLSH